MARKRQSWQILTFSILMRRVCSFTYCYFHIIVSGKVFSYVKVKVNSLSCVNSLRPRGILRPWDSPSKNTGVGCHFFLQGVFLTQGSNLGLPHCGQILYCLSHQGSPGIMTRYKPMPECFSDDAAF